MRISNKLFLGFALIIVLASVIGVIGITGMNKLRAANSSMYENQVLSLEYIGKATRAYKQLRFECRQVVISCFYDDLKGATDAKKSFEANEEEFQYWIEECRKIGASDELIKFYDTIMELYLNTYLPKVNEIIEQSIDDTPEHFNKLYIKVLLASIGEVCDQIENLLVGSMDLNAALAGQANDTNDKLIDRFVEAQTILLVVAAAAAAITAIYITRSISAPINESEDVLSRIAKGDFEARVNGNYKGEFAVIKQSVNETAVHLSIYLKERLQEEKIRKLAAIVAIADAGIIVKDAQGVVTDWNIGAENILGFTQDEMIGKTTHDYAPKESHKAIDMADEQLRNGSHIVHSEVIRKHKDGRLIDCSASYTPILDDDGAYIGSVAIFHDISEKKYIEAALKNAHETILSSIEYASKIQKNLLPWNTVFEQAFSDYSVLWEPKDIVGGDIYWLKNFEDGALLCVCDCTGHGTPGALLTMLVASTLDSIVNKSFYKDTAQIMWMLDHRISSVLNAQMSDEGHFTDIKDGCDIAILFVGKDGSVSVSAGHTHVFICDGREVIQVKGQNIFVGEGKIQSKDDIRVITIPPNEDNKFYVASDGLFDQIGGSPPRPFGYKRFRQLILNNHGEKQSIISKRIREAFYHYQGNQQRRDDFELISFKI